MKVVRLGYDTLDQQVDHTLSMLIMQSHQAGDDTLLHTCELLVTEVNFAAKAPVYHRSMEILALLSIGVDFPSIDKDDAQYTALNYWLSQSFLSAIHYLAKQIDDYGYGFEEIEEMKILIKRFYEVLICAGVVADFYAYDELKTRLDAKTAQLLGEDN